MRLAISNIAWDTHEDEAVAALLHRYGIDAIDTAPGKYFPDPRQAAPADMARVKAWWAERGIAITGMQALLFGTTGFNVFGSRDVQQALLAHLAGVCRIGEGLGATRLVFGSPKNRDRSGLSDAQTLDTAVAFFSQLGDIAESTGVIICLEPNPVCYGANFMTTSLDTADVVEAVNHPAIKMQLDTGALTINHEDPAEILARTSHLIGHVHASEPELLPLGDGGTDHRLCRAALMRHLPHHIVTIEMAPTKTEPHLNAIERALQTAVAAYRSEVVKP